MRRQLEGPRAALAPGAPASLASQRIRPSTAPPPSLPPQVIRANETMYKAGQMERVILRKLSEADPEGKRHCVRQLGSFEYRNHLCLVFESMVRAAWGCATVGRRGCCCPSLCRLT